MKEQVDEAINLIKGLKFEGCLTGSSLLGYFEGQDIDIFAYNEKGFNNLFYYFYYNDMFVIEEGIEQSKVDMFLSEKGNPIGKYGVLSIKFLYNNCVPVNVILKKNSHNLLSVLSSFDMDIICKGYDLMTGKYLDLSENLPEGNATWNRWNIRYSSNSIWDTKKIVRQFIRCIKYHKRGYNTDELTKKYIERLKFLINFKSYYESDKFNSILEHTKEQSAILIELLELWLNTHEISEEDEILLKKKLKEL